MFNYVLLYYTLIILHLCYRKKYVIFDANHYCNILLGFSVSESDPEHVTDEIPLLCIMYMLNPRQT